MHQVVNGHCSQQLRAIPLPQISKDVFQLLGHNPSGHMLNSLSLGRCRRSTAIWVQLWDNGLLQAKCLLSFSSSVGSIEQASWSSRYICYIIMYIVLCHPLPGKYNLWAVPFVHLSQCVLNDMSLLNRRASITAILQCPSFDFFNHGHFTMSVLRFL